jgi:hypothetical protein
VDEDERALATEAWIDLHVPDFGIRARVPPGLHPLLSRDRNRRSLMLTSAPDDWRQALVFTRVPGIGGETAVAWRAEAKRLTSAPDRISAVETGPSQAGIDGVRGHEGWLRFRDADGDDLSGLLWVGQAAEERLTVAYWCAAWHEAERSRWFVGRYRWILASIRWLPLPPETP